MLSVQFNDSGKTWRGSVKVHEKMDNDELIMFHNDTKADEKPLEKVNTITTTRCYVTIQLTMIRCYQSVLIRTMAI